ncbi:MAG: succinate dehydrogenase cytochrome b558 subunit [Bacillaceae bacterium]|nr:succinate dehydrogenase cytochrome b558 subunit [Bacillaceae bacterium]
MAGQQIQPAYNQADTRQFILGRLHSLAGILPLGLFLIEHLYSNLTAVLGADAYNRQVQLLQSIPFLVVFEILFIFIPLIYHAGYGIHLAYLSKNNSFSYRYPRNWMFVLQRISGIVTLIFVVYHVWAFRISSVVTGMEVSFQTVQEHLSNPLILLFYIAGVLSTTFHFSNGLWAGLITWGVTVRPEAQRVSARITFGLFVILALTGIITLFAF